MNERPLVSLIVSLFALGACGPPPTPEVGEPFLWRAGAAATAPAPAEGETSEVASDAETTEAATTPPTTAPSPRMVYPVSDQEGVARDALLRFAPEPTTAWIDLETYRVALVPDAGGWHPSEVLPPWHRVAVYADGRLVGRFTTGGDLATDPPRVAGQDPAPDRNLAATQALELRFGQRLRLAAPAVTVACADEVVPARWLWQRAGARARLEPLWRWPAGTCMATIGPVTTPAGGSGELLLRWRVVAPTGGVRISEVVVDPQRDWSDADGTPFDAVPGAGSVGSDDEFVEIVNASDQVVDLTGWHLEFLDGSDAWAPLDPGEVFVAVHPPGSDLAAVPPCGVVVVGDPPGIINNESVIRLVRPDGSLADRIHLTEERHLRGAPGVYSAPGGGRAEAPEDEAIYPAWVTAPGAPLVRGPATPGSVPCTP